jgi:hypothetical protein
MKEMSEASFLQQVKGLAYIHGWTLHHSQPSLTRTGRYLTTGSPGFPDVVLVHKDKGLIFAELKTTKGKLSEAQENWLAMLNRHAEVYVWRPDDLKDIEHRLSQC